MKLSQTVMKAVESAKIALSDAVVPVDLIKYAKSYNSQTGKNDQVEQRSTINLAITQFEFKEIDGTNIRSDDLKGFIFEVDQDISTECFVEYNETKYRVMSVRETRVGNVVVIVEVQLRK